MTLLVILATSMHVLIFCLIYLLTLYNSLFRLYPGSSDLALSLGLLHLSLGDFPQALHWLGYALAHDGTNTHALLAAGAIIQVE